MIKVRKGDIFSALRTGDVFVHGCNSHGVMGSGIAVGVRERWPLAYQKYAQACQRGVELGDVVPVLVDDNIIVCNAITQQNYGRDGKRYMSYDAVDLAFRSIFTRLIGKDNRVVFPKIGAGLGGGSWDIIETIITRAAIDTGRDKDTELVLYVQE